MLRNCSDLGQERVVVDGPKVSCINFNQVATDGEGSALSAQPFGVQLGDSRAVEVSAMALAGLATALVPFDQHRMIGPAENLHGLEGVALFQVQEVRVVPLGAEVALDHTRASRGHMDLGELQKDSSPADSRRCADARYAT